MISVTFRQFVAGMPIVRTVRELHRLWIASGRAADAILGTVAPK